MAAVVKVGLGQKDNRLGAAIPSDCDLPLHPSKAHPIGRGGHQDEIYIGGQHLNSTLRVPARDLSAPFRDVFDVRLAVSTDVDPVAHGGGLFRACEDAALISGNHAAGIVHAHDSQPWSVRARALGHSLFVPHRARERDRVSVRINPYFANQSLLLELRTDAQ